MKKNWLMFLATVLACIFAMAGLKGIWPNNTTPDESYISDYQRKAVESYIENVANNQAGLPNQIDNSVPTPSVRTISFNKRPNSSNSLVISKRLPTYFKIYSHKTSPIIYRFLSSSGLYVVALRHLII